MIWMFGWTSRESGIQCLTSSKNTQNNNVPKRESPRRMPRSRRIFNDSFLNRIHGTAISTILPYKIHHSWIGKLTSLVDPICFRIYPHKKLEVAGMLGRVYIYCRSYTGSFSHSAISDHVYNKSSNSMFSTKYVNVLPKSSKLRIGWVRFLIGGFFPNPSKTPMLETNWMISSNFSKVQMKITWKYQLPEFLGMFSPFGWRSVLLEKNFVRGRTSTIEVVSPHLLSFS